MSEVQTGRLIEVHPDRCYGPFVIGESDDIISQINLCDDIHDDGEAVVFEPGYRVHANQAYAAVAVDDVGNDWRIYLVAVDDDDENSYELIREADRALS